jgi:hypothetical protein
MDQVIEPLPFKCEALSSPQYHNTHTETHTYTHTHSHTYTHTHMHIHTYAHTLTYTHNWCFKIKTRQNRSLMAFLCLLLSCLLLWTFHVDRI